MGWIDMSGHSSLVAYINIAIIKIAATTKTKHPPPVVLPAEFSVINK